MDESKSKSVDLIVAITSTFATTATAIIGFGGVVPVDSAWRPAVWLVGGIFLLVTIVSTLAFFGIGLWRWCAQALRRLNWIWSKQPQLPSAFPEVADTPVSLMDVFAKFTKNDPAQIVADSLLRAVLAKAQWALSSFCEDAVCSFKHVVAEADGQERIRCIYAPNLPAKYREFSNRVTGVDKNGSYVNQVLHDVNYIIIPDLWRPGVSWPFKGEYERHLRDSGVKGVALAPTCLPDSASNGLEPKAAFKIFAFKPNSLKDDAELRNFLKFYSGMCALAIYMTLQLYDVTYEDIAAAYALRRPQE